METTIEPLIPIVIDVGKVRPKRIKDLKRGQGKLVLEVAEAVEQIRRGLGPEAAGKQLVPVVLVYRRRRAKRSTRSFPGVCA
jgi:hypothetical protein